MLVADINDKRLTIALDVLSQCVDSSLRRQRSDVHVGSCNESLPEGSGWTAAIYDQCDELAWYCCG